MHMTWELRRAGRRDYALLGRLMHSAIHAVPSPYTHAQRRAWSPQPRYGAAWNKRLRAQHVCLAERDKAPLGFMSLEPPGYVDFAYILPEARGTGLFRALHDEIEAEARDRQYRRLYTHASLRAAPAFKALGYRLLKAETVHIKSQRLKRFAMEKHLS